MYLPFTVEGLGTIRLERHSTPVANFLPVMSNKRKGQADWLTTKEISVNNLYRCDFHA